jgi:hypothetical protein
MVRRPRRILTLAGALSLFLVSTGCSSSDESRAYTVPHSLCGTPVDAEALSAFLPAGKKLTTRATSTAQGAIKCRVSVDGKAIVHTSQEWWDEMSIMQFARGLTLDDPDRQTDDGRFAYSGYQAFGRADGCHNAQHRNQVLYTAIQATGSKHRDAIAMKELITKYTQAVGRSSACGK